jgi:DNA repair exonuclease SbcCD nuclease subunit
MDVARNAGKAVVDQWVQDKETVVNDTEQYASEAPQNVRDEAKTAAENAMTQGWTMEQARNAGKAVVDQWESQYAAQLMEAPPIPEESFDVNHDQSITKQNPHSRGGYADILIDQLFLPSGKMIFTYEDGTVHTLGPYTKNQQNQYCFHGPNRCKDRKTQDIGHIGAGHGGYELYLYTNAPPFKCRIINYDLSYTTGHNTLKSVEFKDGAFGGVHINWYNIGSIPPKDNTEYLSQNQDQRLKGLTEQLSVSNAYNTTISDLVNTVITGSQDQLLSVGNALSVARVENTQLSATKREKTTDRNDVIEGRISAQSMALTTLQTGAGGKVEVDNRYISVSTTLSVAKTQLNELSVQLLSVQKAISDKIMLKNQLYG